MRDVSACNQCVVLVEPGDNILVTLDGILARPGTAALHELAVIIDGHENGNVEFEANLVVIGTMTGGGVDRTSTRVERDVVAVDERARHIRMDGMLVRRTGQVNALDHEGLTVLLDDLVARPASLLGDAFQKLTRKYEVFTTYAHGHIFSVPD